MAIVILQLCESFMPKLNQVIAIEKGVKSRTSSALTALYHAVQNAALFAGIARTFHRQSENDDALPPERKNVQIRIGDMLKTFEKALSDELDVQAHREMANQKATASIVVDGTVIAENLPAGMILGLEKRLVDVQTFVTNIPVLDSAESWTWDNNSGLYVTEAVQTRSTKKVQRPLVLYPATDKHPAQTQVISEDVTTGFWHTVKQSGAIPKPEKDALLERVEKLLIAVKEAREKANDIDAGARPALGAPIFNYLFGR